MKIGEWQNRLGRFQRDEGGAVAFLCLIAILILLLVSWTMFDAGLAARDKVRAQTTADSAAYSQAAIKARSMNMIAYANISKRSIWGIHSLYPAYMISTHSWIVNGINGYCETCQNQNNAGTTECRICGVARTERTRWVLNACGQNTPQDIRTEFSGARCDPDDMETWGLFRAMSGRDHSTELRINSSGNRIVDSTWGNGYAHLDEPGAQWGATRIEGVAAENQPGTIFENYMAHDIRAIDNYQRYLVGLTPWWGWSEQLIRSVRNGATISASWPAPVGRFPNFVYAIRNTLLSLMAAVFPGSYGAGQGHAASLYTDSLPVYPGNVGTMRTYLASLINQGPTASNLRSCLLSSLASLSFKCGGVFTAMRAPFFLEHIINMIYFAVRSEGLIKGEYAWSSAWGAVATFDVHRSAMTDNFARYGLRFTENSARNILGEDRIMAEPWMLERPRNDAEWKLKTSNIVLSYINRGNLFDDERGARQKFSLLEDYRSSANQTQRGQELQSYFYGGLPSTLNAIQEITYGSSGYWSLARSEIFFNVRGQDRQEFLPDLWRPSWQARLRPVSLPGEFAEGQYMMNQAFREVMMTIAIGSALGVGHVGDLKQAAIDLLSMERAAMAMGPSTVEGVAK